jgi:small GTP-binding protein
MPKILVVGASGVGKTTLLEKVIKVKPQKGTAKTIGVTFYQHEVRVDDKKYTLQFWDFVGNEKFEFLFRNYVKGTNAAIIIFDWSRIESFIYAQAYLKMIREEIESNIPFLIVGNKIDLVDDLDSFDRSAINDLFDEEGGFYIECSMNNTENFEKAILELIHRINELKLLEVFGKDINLKILVALNMYSELTLNKLASLTNKSKATLSRYTRSLINSGVIKSYSKEKEKQPGSIKKKYYTTDFDLDTNLKDIDFSNMENKSGKEIFSLRAELNRKLYTIMIYEQFSQILNSLIDKFPGGRRTTTPIILSSLMGTKRKKNVNKIIDLFIKLSINLRFLNENQYNKLESLKREFYLKFNKILEEDDGSKKNYVYIDAVLPILQLMELEGYKYKKDSDEIKKLTEEIDKLIQERKKKDN